MTILLTHSLTFTNMYSIVITSSYPQCNNHVNVLILFSRSQPWCPIDDRGLV